MRFPLQVLTFRRLGGRVVQNLPFGVQSQEDDSAITVYTTETGGTELGDPETDAYGHPAGGWVASGSYYASSPDGAFPDQLFEAVTARDLGGRELGHAETTSAFTTSSTHTALQDVPGLEKTVEVGSRPIVVEAHCYAASHSSTGGSVLAIVEGITTITFDTARVGTANYGIPLHPRRRITPTEGEHTYKVQFSAAVVNAAATMGAVATAPAELHVIES